MNTWLIVVGSLRTLSRITNGPLTPPIVLYRILGVTCIIRGSIMGAMAESDQRKTAGRRRRRGYARGVSFYKGDKGDRKEKQLRTTGRQLSLTQVTTIDDL